MKERKEVGGYQIEEVWKREVKRCWEAVVAGVGASAGTGWGLRTITILAGGVALKMIRRSM